MSLTLGRRGLCVLLLSMTASCPPLDDGYPDVSVRVSDYGHSISAVLQATVPQGTWQLRVEGDQQTETGNIKALGLGSISRDPPGALAHAASARSNSSCRRSPW